MCFRHVSARIRENLFELEVKEIDSLHDGDVIYVTGELELHCLNYFKLKQFKQNHFLTSLETPHLSFVPRKATFAKDG